MPSIVLPDAPQGGVVADDAPGDEPRPYRRRRMRAGSPSSPGFIWGERQLELGRDRRRRSRRWRQGSPARGIGKGDRVLVHSKNCDAMFVSMFATFRLGAVWVPTNFRLLPDEVAYLAHAPRARRPSSAMAIFPTMRRRSRRQPRAGIHLADRAGRFRRGRGRRGDRAPCRRERRQRRGRARRPVLVLLHLRHDRALQGRRADPWPDGLRRHQPSLRPRCPARPRPMPRSWSRRSRMARACTSSCMSARGAPTILLPTERFDIDEAYRLIARTASPTCSPCRRS